MAPKPQLCLCPSYANLFATVTLTTLMHFFAHKNIGQPPNSDGFRDYRKRTVVRNVLSTVTQQFKKVEYGFKEVSEKPKNSDIIT